MKKLIIYTVLIITVSGCSNKVIEHKFTSTDINNVISEMTEMMVHDISNPPLASRFFSYACLAGYEVVSQNYRGYPSFTGRLNDYPELTKPDSIAGYDTKLSALLAMMDVSIKMQPSGKRMATFKQNFIDSLLKAGIKEETIENSLIYAFAVSKHILGYARNDNYNKISNFPRYTPLELNGSWYPTPPAYMAAVEPYFHTVRPFTLDSCSQYKPPAAIAFSSDKNSPFFALMMQIYSDTLTEEKRAVAAFWDCNPFALQDNGHLMVGLKKISPGAHWLGITGIACGKANKSFEESMQIFTTVSLGLMDGFISCWDEKYRSNRIRPETAIRKYIDPNWQPVLQTPPFPEYLSGHSTISAASAYVLTHFFGDDFDYTDTVELRYGLPARQFRSFSHAAKEAAISRFYGGIHFMDAIDNGYTQGEQVGARVLEKLSATAKVQ